MSYQDTKAGHLIQQAPQEKSVVLRNTTDIISNSNEKVSHDRIRVVQLEQQELHYLKERICFFQTSRKMQVPVDIINKGVRLRFLV